MATRRKKTVGAEAEPKKRNRRTTEQIVADLEAEIARVKQRAATREAKATADGQAFIAAVRAIDKGIAVARQARNDAMAHALETARARLGEYSIATGVRLPESRRGRRKAGAA